MWATPPAREEAGLNLGLWGSKRCSSQESAFPQLNAKILEGCGLRLFAASKSSPWPAREKVTGTAKVLSQGVGRAWDGRISLCPEELASCCGPRGTPGGRGLAWGPMLGRAGAVRAQLLPVEVVRGLVGRADWAAMAPGSPGRPTSGRKTGG